MSTHVLIVCSGDQCRSPMAAGLARRYCARKGCDLVFRSASTLGIEGRPADPLAVVVCAALGVELFDHVSTSLDADLVEWADHVLVMEDEHASAVLRTSPGTAKPPLHLGSFAGLGQIQSPHGLGEARFRRARDEIELSVVAFVDRLRGAREASTARGPHPRAESAGAVAVGMAAVALIALCCGGIYSAFLGRPCQCPDGTFSRESDGECDCSPDPIDG